MWRCLCAAILVALSCPGAWAAERADESEVKAAVIYNLLLFVHWPPQASPPPVFRLCVFGDGTLTRALRHHERKSVGGQTLEIRHIGADPEETDSCAAVMVEGGSPGVLTRLGVLARSRPLLVIAEGSGAVDRGAMIGLHTDGGRVTFDINHGTMKKSGLTPSSKILRLARMVIE